MSALDSGDYIPQTDIFVYILLLLIYKAYHVYGDVIMCVYVLYTYVCIYIYIYIYI